MMIYDCNQKILFSFKEEEFAGSPMVCQYSNDEKWFLTGITNWRIACAKNGSERPRLFDKLSSNIKWIKESITSET